MALCEDWLTHGGFFWSPPKEVNQPNIHDVIDSFNMKNNLSFLKTVIHRDEAKKYST